MVPRTNPDTSAPARKASLDLYSIALLAILMGAFVLRVYALSRMANLLNYDEAYYASDALSLMAEPRLVPYFDSNDGHESGYMYLLAGWMSVAGVNPFAARVLSALIGTLAVAAIYRLGSQLFGRLTGLYAAMGLAVLFYSVLFNHLVLRLNTFPLMGMLAFSSLFQAMRRLALKSWIVTGVLFGLMAYTYYGEVPWQAFAALIQIGWFVKDKPSRPGVALSLLITATT